jgi:Ca-activated chloride channel family protein
MSARLCLGAALIAASTSLASAEGRPATVIVLDASGSMWGQIDGVNKITIAREVLGDLLTGLPEDQVLGLTTYGHRRKGDCSDIETLIAPGAGTRGAISDAVRSLNPKGKTPLSQAVVEAARALNSTEEAATVILISDGLETCEADPCAVGAELEASGVDFTAHVVGFDVEGDPVARAQLQCLADATGGKYLGAQDANELAAALEQVATAAPEPQETPDPQAPLQLSFAATELYGEVSRPVTTRWTITDDAGETVHGEETDGAGGLPLPAGSYTVTAERLSDGAVQTREVTLSTAAQTVTVTFDAPLPAASLEAPATGPAGSPLSVTWTGPNGAGDYLDTSLPDAPAQQYETYAYTADGNPLDLRLPAQPGDYEIRYIEAETFQVLATLPVSVTAQEQGLTAPETAPIGATIQVGWQGGGFAEDYIDVALPGSEPLTYIGYAYVADGNPVDLRLPVTPGTYEIRYITAQDSSVASRTTITVTDVPTTLSAPSEVAVGAPLEVTWEGPANPGDYLTIATPGDGALGYVTYEYTEVGSPLTLTAPETAGDYVLRYIGDGPDARVLAEVPLAVR